MDKVQTKAIDRNFQKDFYVRRLAMKESESENDIWIYFKISFLWALLGRRRVWIFKQNEVRWQVHDINSSSKLQSSGFIIVKPQRSSAVERFLSQESWHQTSRGGAQFHRFSSSMELTKITLVETLRNKSALCLQLLRRKTLWDLHTREVPCNLFRRVPQSVLIQSERLSLRANSLRRNLSFKKASTKEAALLADYRR